jgi:hypothetical protein
MGPAMKTVWMRAQFKPSETVEGKIQCTQIVNVNGVEKECGKVFSKTLTTRHMCDHLMAHELSKNYLLKHFPAEPKMSSSVLSVRASAEPPTIDLTDESSNKKRKIDGTIQRAFRKQENGHLAKLTADAWAICSLAYSLIEEPAFLLFLEAVRNSDCPFPTRKAIPLAQKLSASELKTKIISSIAIVAALSPVTLATDGWTNIRGVKVTNILLLVGGRAYYWFSICNDDSKNSAAYLAPHIASIIDELIDAGICVVAVVADNEAVNGAIHRRLVKDFPWLVEVGCASHTIQLVVNQTFKEHRMAQLKGAVKNLINSFIKSKELRQTLLRLQALLIPNKKAVRLLHIVPTRWSSEYYASIRLLRVRLAIDALILSHPSEFEPLPADFWSGLEEMVKFLKPMQLASDITQSDSASLFDVFVQFDALKSHAKSIPNTSSLYSASLALTQAIKHHWDAHINEEAVIASAWLSFHSAESMSNQFGAAALTKAKSWFLQFATKYVVRFCYKPDALSEEDLDRLQTDVHNRMEDNFSNFVAPTEDPFVELHLKAAKKKEELALKAVAVNAVPQDEDQLPKQRIHFDSRVIWKQYFPVMPEFVKPVCALLSIVASEAAVERSFSAQDKTHSSVRNSLKDESVGNEVFIKFNTRSPVEKAPAFGAWIEIGDDEDAASPFLLDANNVPTEEKEAPTAAAIGQNGERKEDQNQHDRDEPAANSDRHWAWIPLSGPSRRELCLEWLRTPIAERAVSNFRLRFNDVIEGDLADFARSKSNNDSIIDLKKAVRVCLREQEMEVEGLARPDEHAMLDEPAV